ncbi:cupin domain-containing protein, partial [Streptomyces lycii]
MDVRQRRRVARTAVAGMTLAGLALLPGSAGATPGRGVTSTELAEGTSERTVQVRNKGATDVKMREITIAPGGTTGWHQHPGRLIAVVKSGTLTRTFSDCTTEVSRAGDTLVEEADQVHTGHNHGSEPVVLYVTYVLPAGAPTSHDE